MSMTHGWRTLAKPTYAIRSTGVAVQLPSGSLVQVLGPSEGLPGTAEAVACPEGCLDEWDEYSDVLVTASALRFEGEGA